MVEDTLVGKLKEIPDFRELVGNRIYDSEAPQGELRPRAVYSLVSRRPVKSLSGNSGLYTSRYSLDIYAPSKATVRRLARALQKPAGPGGIVGLRGALLGTNFEWVWIDDEAAGFDPPTKGQQKGTPRATLDLVVWSSE